MQGGFDGEPFSRADGLVSTVDVRPGGGAITGRGGRSASRFGAQTGAA